MPEERRGLSSGAALEGGQDMGTGESLSAPQSVQRLQRSLHAKAKGSPSFRFYSLCDKVWRADVLAVACQEVRRQRRCARGGRSDRRWHRGVRCGPVAWGIGAGPEGGDLSAGCSSTGSHTQEAARDSFGPWAFLAYGTGWRRRRRCWCCRQSSKPTWHRSNTPIVRAVAHTMPSSACIGC